MRLLALLFAAALFAAEPPKLPPALENIVRLAQSAPPEFAADALLRVAASGQVKDKAERAGLIQQAFDLASGAHFRLPMRALRGTPGDSRAGSLAKAYALNLDTLSLQSRAVEAMTALNPAKGREMFASMPPPAPQPLTCDDALVYDVSAYYQALGAVMQNSFTPAERAKDDNVSFLLPYLAQAQSPEQLAPMAALLKTVSATPAQRQLLEVRFEGILEGASADDRSFSAYVTELSQSISPEMNASFRKYADRQLAAANRCQDNTAPGTANLAAAKTQGMPKYGLYWQDPGDQPILAGGKTLRFTSDGSRGLTDAERSAPEWQNQLTDYEQQLANWTAGDKSEIDFFNQKCLVYESLVEVIPPGPERDKALAAFVDFLNNSGVAGESPAEWFAPAQSFLERLRSEPGGREKALAAFQASGNPVLALWSELQRTFPQRAPSFVTNAASR